MAFSVVGVPAMSGPQSDSLFRMYTLQPRTLTQVVNPVVNVWYPVLALTRDCKVYTASLSFSAIGNIEMSITVDGVMAYVGGGVNAAGANYYFTVDSLLDVLNMGAAGVVEPMMEVDNVLPAHDIFIEMREVAGVAGTINGFIRFSTLD